MLKRSARLLSVFFLFASFAMAAGPGDAPLRVSLSDDGMTVTGLAADGALVFTFTMDDWRAWASEHLEARLGGPVMIGDVEMAPSTFYAFGAAAVSPDGTRVLLAATTYAMLTTASVVTLLDPVDLTLEVVAEPAYGDLEEVVWSPDARFVAYTLGSARASGDGLRIDDLLDMRPAFELTGPELLARGQTPDGAAVPSPYDWFPGFRDIRWLTPDSLAFVSFELALPAEVGAVRWSITVDGGDLRTD